MVSDGQYHVAELIAIKKNFTLRVDRGLARSIINEGSKDFLRLTTPMYLGGIPAEPGKDAFTQWHLRNLTSFHGKFKTTFHNIKELLLIYLHIGCMKEVWINHKPVDFGNAQTQQKVQPGCGIVDTDKEEEEQEDEMDEMIGNIFINVYIQLLQRTCV